MLIALDNGHGYSTPGKRTPPIPELDNQQIREYEFNFRVVQLLDVELRKCGFETLLTSPTTADTPLSERVRVANKANAELFISIHYNAFDGVLKDSNPSGFSVHHYPGSTKGKELAELVVKHLATNSVQYNRGVYADNFYVLKNTKMPAILSECGFMDNRREALLMLDEEFQKRVADKHALAVCEYFKIPFRYKICVGTYKSRDIAEMILKELQLRGFDAYIE